MPLPVHFRKCTLLRVLWIFAPRAEKSLSQVRQLHPSRSDLQLLLEDFEACPSRAAACLTFSELTKNKQADFHAAQASSKNDPFATPKHQHISRRNGRPSGGSGVPNVAFGPEEKQAVLDYIYMYILNIIYIYIHSRLSEHCSDHLPVTLPYLTSPLSCDRWRGWTVCKICLFFGVGLGIAHLPKSIDRFETCEDPSCMLNGCLTTTSSQPVSSAPRPITRSIST